MLALELGSFRTSASAKQVSKTEHQWLQYLEKNLSSYLQDNLSVTAKVVQNYMDAFLKVCIVLGLCDIFYYHKTVFSIFSFDRFVLFPVIFVLLFIL